MTQADVSASEPDVPQAPFEPAYAKHKAGIEAVTLAGLREARVDLNAIATRTTTVFDVLAEMRPRIVAELPALDIEVYDSIQERLYAALYCNSFWLSKLDAKVKVREFADAVREWLSKALSAYETLIRFGLANAEPKTRLKRGRGYRALANNMSLVLGVLRGVTPEVLSRTPLEPHDLVQIEHHLLVFQITWGQREFTPFTRHEAGLLRAKAFTYLYDAYELARRAAFYLYGYERGDKLVPSLFVSLGQRKRKTAKPKRDGAMGMNGDKEGEPTLEQPTI